ncbi:hypothetical protein [Dyadobacter sp. NIV53]|uniref:hypothetical protein n=1 Tax=Dyadobacter sp. NIV53 TaxID=2861765 RepID=UPI001C85A68C|nr:hypothetical protein [Dyadobacter sp. NIV53]
MNQEAKRFLQNLEENLKSNLINFNQLEKLIRYFAQHYKYTRSFYNIQLKELIRARSEKLECIEDACKEFNHVDKLSFLRKEYVKNWGRCNAPKESVFYCGDANGVPIFEVKPQEGSYLVVSTFVHNIKPEIDLILPVIGVKQIIDNIKDGLIVDLLKEYDIQSRKSNEELIIDNHFAEWFMAVVELHPLGVRCYELTSILYRIISEMHKDANGLIYPSLASKVSGVNIALKTDYVERNLKVSRAFIYLVLSCDKELGTIILKPLKGSDKIHNDGMGQIEWNHSLEHYPNYILDPKIPPKILEFSHFTF